MKLHFRSSLFNDESAHISVHVFLCICEVGVIIVFVVCYCAYQLCPCVCSMSVRASTCKFLCVCYEVDEKYSSMRK